MVGQFCWSDSLKVLKYSKLSLIFRPTNPLNTIGFMKILKKKPPSVEKKLEAQLRKFAKDNGHECLKLKCMGESGYPDRTFHVSYGGSYPIELKDIGEYADPLQVVFARRLRRAGQQPLLINSFEKLEKFKFHVIHAVPIPADSDLTHFEKPGST